MYKRQQKIWLVSGGVSDRQAMLDAGFDRVIQITPDSMPLEEAMKPGVARDVYKRQEYR